MISKEISRRKFLGSVAAGGAAVLAGPKLVASEMVVNKPAKFTATDLVTLGDSKVKICRMGMGTGSRGGRIQRELGQEKFTKLIRYGIDRGITFIDTADNYDGLHEMIKPTIKGLDREKLQILCKIWAGRSDDPLKEIDRFRKEVGTDYFDVMLIHCQRTHDWVEERKRLRELLDIAKEKKIIRATGVSQHGLPALRATSATDWGDVRLVRINHEGESMDNLKNKASEPGNVKEVVQHLQKMHDKGKGILGMKLIGNGNFQDAQKRRDSINFVMGLGCVDAVTIGFKSPAEIDEAITNINNALALRKTNTKSFV